VTKFAFVATERANHAVATLRRVVGASVSGFYAWLRAIPSRQNRAEAEAALRGHISRIFAAKRRVYGAPRIHAERRREGHRHARRRIERLMRDMGLQAQRGRRRRPQTTDSRHDLPVAPNLLGRSFVAERPDAVWLADGSVRARASKYRLNWDEANRGSCGLQNGQHGRGPPEVEQSAAIGGNMLMVAGARAEEVAQFIVSPAEPGG
jgi:HTH-like domain